MSMLSSIFVLIVISFATYLAINNTDPQVAFYMPYTRAWELALGGVIAFLPEIANKRFSNFRKLLPWIGIILIGAARFSIPFASRFYRKQGCCVGVGSFLTYLCNTANVTSLSDSGVATVGLRWKNLIFDLLVPLAHDCVEEALCGHVNNPPRLRATLYHYHDFHLVAVVAFYRATLPAGSMELEGSIPHVFRQRTGNCLSVRDRFVHRWCRRKGDSISPVD